MQYFKKGTIVFVHTQSYPPWPAQIQRKYQNGLFKVNFIGQKSYTRIQIDKMDLFTEQRAKHIHTQLQDKKLSKSIFVALKQFENRKQRGIFDPELIQFLKKPLPQLNLTMYREGKLSLSTKTNPSTITTITNHLAYSMKQFSPSSCVDDNIGEIGKILDHVYEHIVMPVQQKLPQYINQSVFSQKKSKLEEQIYKIKQLFVKEQQNFNMFIGTKQVIEPRSTAQQAWMPSSITYKRVHPSQSLSIPSSKSFFLIEKLIDFKIIQRIIMTIKAYQSFRQQSQKDLGEFVQGFLRQRLGLYADKFRDAFNRKKIPTHKDRIILEKFQAFQAYL